MPSPALQKLETLPLTPLQSAPNSPGSSKPSSRRGSSTLTSGNHAAGSSASLASLRKLSMGAHTTAVHPSASGLSALSSRKSSTTKSTSADGTQSTEAPTSPSTSKLDTTDASAAAAAARKRKESEEAIEQAVSEEQMLPEVSPVATSGAAASASQVHAESALDDDEDEDDDEADQPEGVLRTGNERFRTGSRRLSRMSSTLGEGITAHWKRSTPPVVSSPGQIKSPSQAGTPAAADTSPTTAEVQNVQKAQQQVQSTPMPPSALVQALRERQKRSPPSDRGPSNERVKAEPSAAALPSSAIPPGSPLHKSKDFARASGSSPPPLPKLPPIEHAKRLAAYRAVDVHVKPHHRVIGIGSGSTVPYVVDRLLEQGEEANRKRWFVPTGFQSKELIVNAGLKLGDVDQFPGIDVTIDGADDVDFALNAIKGGGACHLREKVLAEAAEEFIIVADYRKNNMLLGQSWKQGIPIETPAFAYSKVLDNLERIPGCIDPQLRMGKAKAGPLVTDNGNFVIDAPFDEAHMREPENLLVKIKMLTGVVEVGLFCGMARAAYFGNADGSVTVRWSDGQTETLKEGEEAKIKAETVDENSRPTDVLLTWQPQQPESETTTKTEASDISKLKQKLENLRMTST